VGTVGTSFFRFVSTRLTDGQTGGRTDKKALKYRALHYMQSHGKKTK